MEDEIVQVHGPISGIVESDTNNGRPFSPTQCINLGALDGRPVTNAGTPMEALLVANFKLLKAATRDDLSNKDRKKLTALAESFTVNDIKKACEDMSNRSISSITAIPDNTIKRVKPPNIHEGATDKLSPQASKDFHCRTNGGYFGDLKHHSIKIRDLLDAVTDVCESYNLGSKAAISLIRRSLKDPARTFMENLLDSGTSLTRLFEALQDHYSYRMAPGEASKKLVQLLEKPIGNLDSFLTEVLPQGLWGENRPPA